MPILANRFVSKGSVLIVGYLCVAGIQACSNSASGDAGSTMDSAVTMLPADNPIVPGDVPTGMISDATAAEGCISQTAIHIVFSPMYSATDGMHRFRIPAIVVGIDQTLITWTASDHNSVSLANDPTTGGVMITALAPATVTITAQAGDLCGSSVLTIASATPDDWMVGSERYNNGISYRPPSRRDAGLALADAAVSSTIPACTNCHGPTATDGRFRTVAHTPEQTGGYNDSQLDGIIRHGTVPDGGYFDPSIVPYAAWHAFHQWTLSDEELKGVIVYLRSLTPAPQTGASNFGGMFGPGPGRGPGGDGG